MAETKKMALPAGFDRSVMLQFHASRMTSDAGWVAYRELQEALGLTVMAALNFED